MKNLLGILLIAAALGAVTACGPAEAEFDVAAHKAEVEEWRAGRLERLLRPTGYLTQVGLFWLEDGEYSVGSAAGSDVLLPPTAAPSVGTLAVADGGAHLSVTDGVTVTSAGETATELAMPADSSGEVVIAEHGSIAWSVIERGGKLAVRVRDFEHPWIENFGPLPYYDISPDYRVEATLQRYPEPRVISVNTVIEGFTQNPIAPGTVSFEIDGTTYDLEPTISGDKLFFVFGDSTNGKETYGAGRFLYSDMPGDDGSIVLDFNKSYSPPCAFNDFSTCPIASPRNRLPVRIAAGERYESSLHYSPES